MKTWPKPRARPSNLTARKFARTCSASAGRRPPSYLFTTLPARVATPLRAGRNRRFGPRPWRRCRLRQRRHESIAGEFHRRHALRVAVGDATYFDIRVSSLLRKTLKRSRGLAGPAADRATPASGRNPDSAAGKGVRCSCWEHAPYGVPPELGSCGKIMVTTDIDRDGVAKVYARWAPVYDLVFGAVFERGRRAAIAASERVGGRILEVGVGTGISLPYYSDRSRVFGIDLSAHMLQKARRRVAGRRLNNVERLAVMDAERLDFPDASFDVVVAQYVVNTVPHPEIALDEFARVLKP